MENIIKTTITVKDVVSKPVNNTAQISLVDNNNDYYSFFKHKKDGTESKAYQVLAKLYSTVKGSQIEVGYKENKGYKNVAFINEIKEEVQSINSGNKTPQNANLSVSGHATDKLDLILKKLGSIEMQLSILVGKQKQKQEIEQATQAFGGEVVEPTTEELLEQIDF